MIGAEGSDVLAPSPSEARYGTQSDGIEVLLRHPLIQRPDPATKRQILELLYLSGAFRSSSFDAILVEQGVPELTVGNVGTHINQVKLVEMKTTRAPIRNAALNGFFFGATDNEFYLAKALKDRYLFAFVVLSEDNDYGQPFFVLLTLEQLQARTRTSRVQYQVNFRNDMPIEDEDAFPNSGFVVLSNQPS